MSEPNDAAWSGDDEQPEGPQTDWSAWDEQPTDLPPGREPASDRAVLDEPE